MKVAFNRPGNLDGDVGLGVFEANGISQDDIKKWGGQVVRAASREMTSLMLDRRLDGVDSASPSTIRASARWQTASTSSCCR